MDQLPDLTGCPRNGDHLSRDGAIDYDHALRQSGARLVSIDYRAADALQRIERAINTHTAAVGFVVWQGVEERPRLADLVCLCIGMPNSRHRGDGGYLDVTD